ncbi:MAG: 4Fe-4S binding protein [Clostridiales Family XIII bacterium]|jgi:2-oxoacid:acceptor oxidoreductase delta subunit (pyruvate/2-ketoisovalerate family)|nr:4Fe-4S binding protein [Clostridiales Family XIII bacterium]
MIIKPTLRDRPGAWALSDYPEGTYWEAGYLTQKNAGWRSERPVIDKEKCTGCLQCYLYCPDGTIDSDLNIDCDFCKGCGICAKICRVSAIRMEGETR